MYTSTGTSVLEMFMICMFQFEWYLWMPWSTRRLKIDSGNPCLLNHDSHQSQRLLSFRVQRAKLSIWLNNLMSSFSRFLFAQTSIISWCSLLSEIPRPLRASAEVARSEYFHCSAVSTLFAGSRFNEGRGPLDRIVRLAWLWRVAMCSDDVPMGGFWIILFFETRKRRI